MRKPTTTSARILLQKGRFDEAIARCQQAVKIQPRSARAHNNLAIAFLGKGQAREAVAQYNTSLEIQPDNARTLSNLAWVLATWPGALIRNGDTALQLAQRASHLTDGHDPLIFRTLAAAYAETGQFTEAIASARQALQSATTEGDAHLTNSLLAQLELYQAGCMHSATRIISLFLRLQINRDGVFPECGVIAHVADERRGARVGFSNAVLRFSDPRLSTFGSRLIFIVLRRRIFRMPRFHQRDQAENVRARKLKR